MAKPVHPSTLFHLVPENDVARASLTHPNNQRFVSATERGALGLEIGFHVSSIPGRVIARLGRGKAADLTLRGQSVSAIHIAFELHPETHALLLSVRSKQLPGVRIKIGRRGDSVVDGDCVLAYDASYKIEFANYAFALTWFPHVGLAQDLAVRDYREALERQRFARSHDLPTVNDSTMQTWHNTRIHTAKRILFREAPKTKRVPLGSGSQGSVFQTVDFESGNPFAVKVLNLSSFSNPEYARAAAHREVKTLERLSHRNIIELLGTANWDSPAPELYMPLRAGSLVNFTDVGGGTGDDEICMQVLEQMLAALDYLGQRGICHRDIKPANILFYNTCDGNRTFQLADFGLVNHYLNATTECGTIVHMAPEVHSDYKHMGFPKTPKMDVWSLFTTVIAINARYRFPPPEMEYRKIVQAVRDAANDSPALEPMARINPEERASAAQMLVACFEGVGLSQPRATVPPIAPKGAEAEIQTSGGEGTVNAKAKGKGKERDDGPSRQPEKAIAEPSKPKSELDNTEPAMLITYPRNWQRRRGGPAGFGSPVAGPSTKPLGMGIARVDKRDRWAPLRRR